MSEPIEQIQPFVESARKRTSPWTVDLYKIFCAILYILKSGCQWRMLRESPKWQSVYGYWRIWSREPSLLEQVLKKIGSRGPKEPWAQRYSKHVNSLPKV